MPTVQETTITGKPSLKHRAKGIMGSSGWWWDRMWFLNCCCERTWPWEPSPHTRPGTLIIRNQNGSFSFDDIDSYLNWHSLLCAILLGTGLTFLQISNWLCRASVCSSMRGFALRMMHCQCVLLGHYLNSGMCPVTTSASNGPSKKAGFPRSDSRTALMSLTLRAGGVGEVGVEISSCLRKVWWKNRIFFCTRWGVRCTDKHALTQKTSREHESFPHPAHPTMYWCSHKFPSQWEDLKRFLLGVWDPCSEATVWCYIITKGSHWRGHIFCSKKYLIKFNTAGNSW